MSTAPRWEDSGQGDLLSLVATGPMSGQADEEWALFVAALKCCAGPWRAVINPNDLRPLLRDQVKPQRIGAFTSRALAQGLITYTGDWVTSTDTDGRNSGKPARTMFWTGSAL